MNRKAFEYEVLDANKFDAPELRAVLGPLGEEGWFIAGIVDGLIILSRPMYAGEPCLAEVPADA